ncbi:hypothetical protein S40285_02647 [Stachybotrys chlorohalonatus IBT 40285]|uniref:Uncharacterized protein n=1 Tax=Stachybotrys chlorohalonatus (strain IBT 40285) TaxID=1283841 RepID=A0A084QXH9_STAC4|nr:hypothetical protein S40285_02647 [Stachybotrys chlorohalonata IBT 40285]
MDVKQTSARLRRTFHYPADDDSSDDSQPEVIDEEEQDRLIERLAADNAARDAQFRRILIAIPVLATVPYLPALFRPATTFFALLTITSLLSTAYLLHVQPAGHTGIAPLDAWIRGADVKPGANTSRLLPRGLGDSGSPLQTYLPYLNVALVLVVALMGLRHGPTAAPIVGWVGTGNLPVLIHVAILAANLMMGSVDPERELSGLRYQYKGA